MTQERMKLYADKKMRDVQFKVGVLDYLMLKPYQMELVAKITNEDLSPRFHGPFKVLERVREVAYCLEFPSFTKIH